MEKGWLKKCRRVIFLITCFCLLHTYPASAVDRDRRNENENSPELISYFRQQHGEDDSTADVHIITPLHDDKQSLANDKLLSEVELASFMHPAHRPILPSRRNTSTSLFAFFNKEQHPPISTITTTRPTSEIDGDDAEYESDLEEEKSLLSPLENLPIISNLITGKGLDFHGNEANTATSRTKVNHDDGGFNVNIKNEDKKAGSIEALPENARMDLEDPTQGPDLLVEDLYQHNRTIASKRTKNSTLQKIKTTASHNPLQSQYLVNSTNKPNTNKTLQEAFLKTANTTKIHNNTTKSNTSLVVSTAVAHNDKIPKLDQKLTPISITKLKPGETTHNFKNSYMNHTVTKDKKPINSLGNIHYHSNMFYLSKLATNTSTTSTKPSKMHHLNTNSSKVQNKQVQPHTVGSSIYNKSNQTSLQQQQQQQQQQRNGTKAIHQKENATTTYTVTGKNASHINQTTPKKPLEHNVSQSKSHEISFKNAKSSPKVHSTQTSISKVKQALVPVTKINSSESVFKEKEQAQKQYQNNDIQFIQLPLSDDARCMDGSSPAYYFRKGYGDGKANWIIHLHGGAWCYDLRSCSKRRNSILGSTKRSLEEDIGGFFHGILSNDHKVNPNFYNWNNIVLTYCDGGLFSGNRDKPLVGKGKKYYFQGRRVLRSQLEDIKKKMNLTAGKNIILSGTSAGGLSLILQANYIRRFLPEKAKIRGLVDAGYFLDQDSIFNTSISNVQFKAMYSLHRPTLSRSCVEKQTVGKKFKCLFPQETIKYVKIPLFLVNSLYDHWQLSYLEGISCVYDDNKCE